MEQNPYQPPPDDAGAANVGKSAKPSRIILAIFVVAIVATALTFAIPAVAVPAALLLLPAGLRIMRVRAVRTATHGESAIQDGVVLFLVSLLAAVPVGAASLVLFCCVCTPVGFVATSIRSQAYGPTPAGLAIAVFLGLLAGLFFGTFLMRRLGFFSAEVRNAARRP